MAGLYDRFIPGAEDKLAVHLFTSVLGLRAEGEINDSQALSILNEHIENPLAGIEIADASAILAALNGKASAVDKLLYSTKVNNVCLVLEIGTALATETAWRSICEI